MSRKPGHVPAYRLHKPSGQARVIVGGEHIYLGRYGSTESREKYARIIAESSTGKSVGNASTTNGGVLPELSINELILSYWRFAETYYSKDGQPTKELACMREGDITEFCG